MLGSKITGQGQGQSPQLYLNVNTVSIGHGWNPQPEGTGEELKVVSAGPTLQTLTIVPRQPADPGAMLSLPWVLAETMLEQALNNPRANSLSYLFIWFFPETKTLLPLLHSHATGCLLLELQSSSPSGSFLCHPAWWHCCLGDCSGHTFWQSQAGSVSDAWQLMNHCESGTNWLPSSLKWAEYSSHRPTPSFPIYKKRLTLFVLPHQPASRSTSLNGVSFPIRNCNYICRAWHNLMYVLLIKHRLWFNKSIQQFRSKPLWAKSFLMLNVSLSNLSYFSISSFKMLLIKNAEGDDHEDRLKKLNNIFEIITALHCREQCLLTN